MHLLGRLLLFHYGVDGEVWEVWGGLMKATQTARWHPANHAFMNEPDVCDCFALAAKLFNTFGDLLQIGDAGATRVKQIRGTLCDKIKRKHINRLRMCFHLHLHIIDTSIFSVCFWVPSPVKQSVHLLMFGWLKSALALANNTLCLQYDTIQLMSSEKAFSDSQRDALYSPYILNPRPPPAR